MYARITTLHTDTSGQVDHLRDVAPQLWSGAMAQPGCLGGLVLADPVSGTVHAITFWNSADELVAARRTGQVITDRAGAMVGASNDATVVQLLDVIGMDMEGVLAATNRRGQTWPVLAPNETS